MNQESIQRDKSVCFSGHRGFKICSSHDCETLDEISLALSKSLSALLEQGYRRFYCGMAEGFDLLAAEEFFKLRDNYPHAELVAVIPHLGQDARFKKADRERYNEILSQADHKTVLSDAYHHRCYLLRNDFMLDRSSLLLCYFNGSAGGTKYTVTRARKLGCRVINLFEANQQLEFTF